MVGGSTTYAKLQVAGTSQSESSISLVNNEADTKGPFVFFGKTRGSSVGASTIVQNGDTLGGLSFIGADGNDTNNRTAEITAVVNGGPGNNTIPTDLTFSTSTQNATQLTERMRIYSTGRILIGNGASEQGPSGNLDIVGDINGNGGELYLRVSNNNVADNIGALLFGNNVDKSIVKIQGVTHTANNTGDIAFHTSNAGSMSERLRITNSGKLCMGGSTGQYTLNNTSTDIIIGSGGSGRGITFHTSAYADNMTISFHANENLSRAEGEIKYGPPLTSTSADRNAMMFRTNSSERLRITSGGILEQSATGGDNQFVSTRTGATYNDGDYYFQLFAKNNSSTTMGALGIVRDTGNNNSRMMFHTADGGTNKERARINRWGGLQLRNIIPPYGSSEPASRYIYSYHRSGTYNTFWAEIRFASPGSYCLDLRMGGYSNRHMHYTFQGYVYAGNDFASAAAIDSGNGPQRYYSNQGAYNTYGTIIRFGFSSMSATHPVVHMDLSYGAAGGDSLAEITNMLWS